MTQVTNGKGAMPAFGGRLSDDDIANVAAFVIESSTEGW
jgi:cytochrome c6